MHVPDEIRKCVAFVCSRKANEDEYIMRGTCFFACRGEANSSSFLQIYAITAKHVIEGFKGATDGQVYIRLNLCAGGVRYYATKEIDWRTHPSDATCDVATTEFSYDPTFDMRYFPLEAFLTEEAARDMKTGVGDECFIVGLFKNHTGENKSIPIVRFGNISAMMEERVRTARHGSFYAYLLECRSIGGLSGAPVFVVVPHQSIIIGGKQPIAFQLLGLMHGHWDLGEINTDSADFSIDAMRSLKINMGIGIAVPASAILEVLKQNYLNSEVIDQGVFHSIDVNHEIPEKSDELSYSFEVIAPSHEGLSSSFGDDNNTEKSIGI